MRGHDRATLRLLHVMSGDLWAGAEVMAHTLIRELARTPGYDVRVAVLNKGQLADKLLADGIDTWVLDERSMNSVRIGTALANLCRVFGPHVVHTHRKKENVLGALAARITGTRSLRTVHGWSEFQIRGLNLPKRAFRWFDVATGRYLQDRVVAVSEDLRDRLVSTFGAQRLAVVENGVDLATVRLEASVPARLPGVPGCRRVGIIARLVPVKRHDRFLDAACSLLASGRRDCRFFLVGDGPEAGSIETRIQRSGYPDRFHMLGFRQDVLPVMAALDAIVVCSDHEGIPMNVLEAAALGVPIVTIPLPSIVSILRSGARGIVASSDDGGALAQAIDEVLDEGGGDCASLDDDWRFSAHQMAERYRAVYAEVLAP